MLQAFVSAQVLEADLIAGARRERGKFRSYLLLALDRFVVSQRRNDSRAKRSPNGSNEPDSAGDAALANLIDPAPPPDEAFELAWARQVLVYAARRMRDACRDAGRADAWVVFEARVLGPTLEGGDAVPLEQLVDRLGLASAQQASNLLVTAKRMFGRSLRDVIREYLADEAEVEAEVADLRRILGRGGRRETIA